MSPVDLNLIERFFEHRLSPEETALLRQKAEQDADFQQHLAMHGLSLEILRAALAARLREKWQSPAYRASAEAAVRVAKRGLFVRTAFLAALLLGILGGSVWFVFFRAKTRPAPQKLIEQLAPPASDTIQRQQIDVPKNPDSTPPPVSPAQKTPNPLGEPARKKPSKAAERPIANKDAALRGAFAAAFSAYPNAGVRASERDSTRFNLFLKNYEDSHFAEALPFSDGSEQDSIWAFLRANALLATEQPLPAISILERLLKTCKPEELSRTQWYLALAYGQTGQFERAKSLLEKLAAQAEGGFKVKSSQNLLKKLQSAY